MLQMPITIINKLGLHTRAAAKLVATAGRFESKIELKYKDYAVDAKSIMGLITLGAKRDTVLELKITGPDELEARDAIIELVNNRFCEPE